MNAKKKGIGLKLYKNKVNKSPYRLNTETLISTLNFYMPKKRDAAFEARKIVIIRREK